MLYGYHINYHKYTNNIYAQFFRSLLVVLYEIRYDLHNYFWYNRISIIYPFTLNISIYRYTFIIFSQFSSLKWNLLFICFFNIFISHRFTKWSDTTLSVRISSVYGSRSLITWNIENCKTCDLAYCFILTVFVSNFVS